MVNISMSAENQIVELEDKLNFAVTQFEEQNRRFQECGQELAISISTIENQEELIRR